jgi:hypothetical protein
VSRLSQEENLCGKQRKKEEEMKWVDDLIVWAGLLFFYLISVGGSYVYGKATIVDHCNTYGAYKLSDEEVILCVLKPLLKNNEGELNYLRPKDSKPIKVKEI